MCDIVLCAIGKAHLATSRPIYFVCVLLCFGASLFHGSSCSLRESERGHANESSRVAKVYYKINKTITRTVTVFFKSSFLFCSPIWNECRC